MTACWKIAANPFGITRLSVTRATVGRSRRDNPTPAIRRLAEPELRQYLSRRIQSFSIAFDISDLLSFARSVLRETAKIAYGHIRTYRWLGRI